MLLTKSCFLRFVARFIMGIYDKKWDEASRRDIIGHRRTMIREARWHMRKACLVNLLSQWQRKIAFTDNVQVFRHEASYQRNELRLFSRANFAIDNWLAHLDYKTSTQGHLSSTLALGVGIATLQPSLVEFYVTSLFCPRLSWDSMLSTVFVCSCIVWLYFKSFHDGHIGIHALSIVGHRLGMVHRLICWLTKQLTN